MAMAIYKNGPPDSDRPADSSNSSVASPLLLLPCGDGGDDDDVMTFGLWGCSSSIIVWAMLGNADEDFLRRSSPVLDEIS